MQTVEHRQGLKIASLQEIAWRKGWINDEQLKMEGNKFKKTQYGQYLLDLLDNG